MKKSHSSWLHSFVRNRLRQSFLPLLLILIVCARYQEVVSERRRAASSNLPVQVRLFATGRTDANTFIDYGKYRFRLPKQTQLSQGRWYSVVGKVDRTARIENSYRILLKVQSIQAIPKCRGTGKCWLQLFHEKMFHVRQRMEMSIWRAFPQYHAQIILGIVFGRNLEPNSTLYDRFQQSGMLHTVVASGSNIALIVAVSAAFITLFFRVRKQIVFTITALLLYLFLVGFEPSLLRASSLFAVVLLAQLLGRPMARVRSFLIAVLFLLCFDPMLLFSVSFQLSVAATFGIVVFAPTRYLQRSTAPMAQNRLRTYIAETLQVTFATHLYTFPLIAHYFQTITGIGFLTNVFALWLIPIIFCLGLVFMIAAAFVPLFFLFALQVCLWLCTELLLALVTLFSQLPLAQMAISPPSPRGIIVLYCAAAGFGLWILAGRSTQR